MQPFGQHFSGQSCSALKKGSLDFNIMHIFGLYASTTYENQHQICWRIFSKFGSLENTSSDKIEDQSVPKAWFFWNSKWIKGQPNILVLLSMLFVLSYMSALQTRHFFFVFLSWRKLVISSAKKWLAEIKLSYSIKYHHAFSLYLVFGLCGFHRCIFHLCAF